MEFELQRVWVIGYGRCMGYCLVFPAYQVGRSKKLWGTIYYGLSGLWNKRASTVFTYFHVLRHCLSINFVAEQYATTSFLISQSCGLVRLIFAAVKQIFPLVLIPPLQVYSTLFPIMKYSLNPSIAVPTPLLHFGA